MNKFQKIVSDILANIVWMYQWIKTHLSIRDLIILALIVFVICSMGRCSSYKKGFGEKVNIINALDDSLYDYKSKNDELYKLKKTYIADMATLEQVNKDLYNEVKYLKDHPVVVTKIEYQYVIDSIEMKDTIRQFEDKYFSDWDYKDTYVSITGNSVFDTKLMQSTTTLERLEMNLDMNVDLIEKNGQLSFIANSSNPYVHINDINGAVVSPEKSKTLSSYFNKKNHIGFSVGFGAIAGYGYGTNGPGFFVGAGGFAGITYTRSLFSW